jgi:hypothetical protein
MNFFDTSRGEKMRQSLLARAIAGCDCGGLRHRQTCVLYVPDRNGRGGPRKYRQCECGACEKCLKRRAERVKIARAAKELEIEVIRLEMIAEGSAMLRGLRARKAPTPTCQ